MIMHGQSRGVSEAWRPPRQQALANQGLTYSVIFSVCRSCASEKPVWGPTHHVLIGLMSLCLSGIVKLILHFINNAQAVG